MEQINYLESGPGDKSSSRLIAFVIIMVALIDVNVILIFGRDNIMVAAAAAGTLFLTIAGSAMVFLFQQKKNEIKASDATDK